MNLAASLTSRTVLPSPIVSFRSILLALPSPHLSATSCHNTVSLVDHWYLSHLNPFPYPPSHLSSFLRLNPVSRLPKNPVQRGAKRFISVFPRLVTKIIKVPVYLGGSLAAAGSYVAYKVDQTSSYAMDKLNQFRDFTASIRDGVNSMFPGSDGAGANGSGNNGNSGNGGSSDGGEAGVSLLGAMSSDDERKKRGRLGEEEEGSEEDGSRKMEKGNDNYDSEDEDDDDKDESDEDTTQDEMLNLTKQMIEIRAILNKIDSSSAHLTLPSIVVIGSQSSGKSSVLEAIVGKEFLPKGNNMVTRRPIELTLVNTPNSDDITADFPAQRLYNIRDFKEVKRILTELNLSVPSTETISEDPIQLTVKSSRVPDLSLVDLPGYIQIEAVDQPPELKSRIQQLCDKYLDEPNIILAISAADVDLANSSALRAAKAADPRGLRTIGVVTKLDLVTPSEARDILNNKKYPLKMGYVGVITKPPDKLASRLRPFGEHAWNRSRGGSGSGTLFGKRSVDEYLPGSGQSIFSSNKADQGLGLGLQQFESRQFEKVYFRDNKKYFADCEVSTKTLREKLIKILEMSMSNALEPTSRVIQKELDDASYLFKVEFNDRQLTPKSYLLNNIDVLKLAIKEFQENFDRNELKSILKADLDQKVLDILASRYWRDEHLPELQHKISTENAILYWHKKLDLASSSLTKVGIGRLSTVLTTSAILKELDNILDETQLKNHDLIRDLVTNTAVNVLNAQYYSTADQVENCIKPYKYEIDLEPRDWDLAREHSIRLIREELAQCQMRLNAIKGYVGSKKLQRVMNYLEENSSTQRETLGMSKLLLERGSEALFLDKRAKVLNFRLAMLKNKCYTTSEKERCPEVFLNAVSEKLTSTAVLFLNVELLSDFFYNFPIELDRRLGTLTDEQIEIFAKEDPKVAEHIELQKRKELLELALEKINSILVFEKGYKNIKNSKRT